MRYFGLKSLATPDDFKPFFSPTNPFLAKGRQIRTPWLGRGRTAKGTDRKPEPPTQRDYFLIECFYECFGVTFVWCEFTVHGTATVPLGVHAPKFRVRR